MKITIDKVKEYQYLEKTLRGTYELAKQNVEKAISNIKEGRIILDSNPVLLDCLAFYDTCNMECVKCLVREEGKRNIVLPLLYLFHKFKNFFKTALYILECPDGEPLTNPHYNLLLQATSSEFPRLYFATNGTLFNEENLNFTVGRVRGIGFTLDTIDTNAYQKLHGDTVLFKKTITNLKKLLELKKKQNSPYPKIYIHHCLYRQNLNMFSDFYNYFKNYAIDGIWIIRLVENEHLKKYVREQNGFIFNYTEQLPDEEEIFEVIDKHRNSDALPIYENFNTVTTLIIDEGFLRLDGPLCCAPWLYMGVTSDGYNRHCCFGTGAPFGKWLGTKIQPENIWNNEIITKIREQILNYGIAHFCLMSDTCPIVRKIKLISGRMGNSNIINEVRNDFSKVHLLRPYIKQSIKNTTRENAWWIINGEKVKIKETAI